MRRRFEAVVAPLTRRYLSQRDKFHLTGPLELPPGFGVRQSSGALETGSSSRFLTLRFLLRLRRMDFRPRGRLPDVQEAVLAQGADGIAVG